MKLLTPIISALGISLLISTAFAARADTGKTRWIVAADGSGDFVTLQDAIAALPDQSPVPLVLHIKPGTYQGQIILPKEKTNVKFEGEDAASTVLTFNLNTNEENPPTVNQRYKGTGVVILGDNFRADKITFQNASGDHGQALALRIDGDRAIVTRSRLLGWQDTLMLNQKRQYFRDSYIEGRVDFIYGSGTSVFENCEIKSKNGGHITAASTPQEQPFGFVFLNCKLTGDPKPWIDPATNAPPPGRRLDSKADLGRPWRPYGNVAYINTQMGDHITPLGWNNWGKVENEKTARYAEFNSQTFEGQPLDVSQRLPWSKQLTAEEAAKYTLANIFGDWNPLAQIEYLPATIAAAPQVKATTIAQLTPVVLTRPTFVLAGDSTVTDNAGWGTGFKNLLKPNVTLVNLAKGGRSSRSFRDEGSWQKALDLKPQYVLIQFGHNDQPGHGPERESDPTLYRQNIARYVDEARAAGITPILVTPLSRRQWDANNKINSTLAPYAAAVQSVAKEKNVALIDLHSRSIAFYETQGKEKINALSPSKEEGKLDGTHLNAQGSAAIAPLVADELKKAIPALANDFTP